MLLGSLSVTSLSCFAAGRTYHILFHDIRPCNVYCAALNTTAFHVQGARASALILEVIGEHLRDFCYQEALIRTLQRALKLASR